VKKPRADEAALRTDVVRLAGRFGRYGYGQITNLLLRKGWQVNHKRVERLWRQQGLKVPRRQPKRGRLWLARLGVRTLYIEPGSPWKNGYNKRFNGKLRDEFLNGEIFYILPEAVVLVEQGTADGCWSNIGSVTAPGGTSDVAAVGGWQTEQTLKTAYQQADAETMLRVVLGAGQLREAK
jgi:transposase InsO family protein